MDGGTNSAPRCPADHILDAEIVYSGRYRFILAHDAPPIPGYDQGLSVDRLPGSASPRPLTPTTRGEGFAKIVSE